MRKILFVLMAAAMLVSCDNRQVPYRVKDCVTQRIDIFNLDSGFRVNDTVTPNGYAYKYVILERVK